MSSAEYFTQSAERKELVQISYIVFPFCNLFNLSLAKGIILQMDFTLLFVKPSTSIHLDFGWMQKHFSQQRHSIDLDLWEHLIRKDIFY